MSGSTVVGDENLCLLEMTFQKKKKTAVFTIRLDAGKYNNKE